MAPKNCYIFLYFRFMITLLATCLIINIFFGSIVNDTFSNLKLNAFIITGFIYSNKCVKQLVLINHSRKMGGGEGTFSPKRERLVK